jgi:hypothetical protein
MPNEAYKTGANLCEEMSAAYSNDCLWNQLSELAELASGDFLTAPLRRNSRSSRESE